MLNFTYTTNNNQSWAIFHYKNTHNSSIYIFAVTSTNHKETSTTLLANIASLKHHLAILTLNGPDTVRHTAVVKMCYCNDYDYS